AFNPQPAGATGGTAFGTQPIVTIQDAGGNTVTTDTNAVTMAIGTNPSTGVLSTCTSTTTAGVAAFTGCSINKAANGYTLTATDTTDTLTQISSAFNVTVGPAAALIFTVEPGNGTGGSALSPQPTVTILDAGGNTVTTDTNAVTMAIGTNPGPGTLSTCTSTTTAGVAAFTGCAINKPGTGYTLTASDSTDALTQVSTAFSITVGPAAALVFTVQPGNGLPGMAVIPQPTVTIQDAGGNTLTTDVHAVTMAIGTNPSTGTLSTCTSTTSAGVATFTGCTINNAGTGYTLTATDAGDALSHTSAPFNVNALTVSCAPTGLTAAANNGAVTLNWVAPSCNGGSAVTGYSIFEGTGPGAESTTPLNSSFDSTTTYVANGLTNGTTYYFRVQAVNAVGPSTSSNEASASPVAASPNGGYWEVASDGGVFSFGNAGSFGSAAGLPLNHPAVGMTPTHDRQGYWLVASDGGIFNYGDAHFYGSTGGMSLNKPIVGMAATTDGGGYWLVASDGGIFAYGDAHFYGSTGGMALNKPIVGMAANPAGGGYWLVASDGGIFNYGNAAFEGSTGGTTLNKPVVGMAAAPDGSGYWLVASDGGIFNYGSAGFFGSIGGMTLNKPVIGMG
ncbi:MAG TPA: fibronectin type III domain-containing protein, partial [Acidimicrobiales bacterium]